MCAQWLRLEGALEGYWTCHRDGVMVDITGLDIEIETEENQSDSDSGESATLEGEGHEFAAPRQSLYDLTVLRPEVLDAAVAYFHDVDSDGDGRLVPTELEEVFDRMEYGRVDMVKDLLAEMHEARAGAAMIDLNGNKKFPTFAFNNACL